jgi:hypothetical protein
MYMKSPPPSSSASFSCGVDDEPSLPYSVDVEPSAGGRAPYSSDLHGPLVLQLVRKTTIHLAVCCVLALTAAVLIALIDIRQVSNLLKGPTPIEQTDLVSLRNADEIDAYYVLVHGDEVVDSGFNFTHTTTWFVVFDSKEKADFVVLVVGERLLLAKVAPGGAAPDLEGYLVNMPLSVTSQVIEKLQSREPETRGLFLPVMLDATKPGVFNYSTIIILFVVSVVVTLLLRKAFRQWRNPWLHPGVRALEGRGVVLPGRGSSTS